MGAKWLYQLRSAPGQQTSTLHLFDRFEALGAKKICKWKTHTFFYKRHQQQGVQQSEEIASDAYIVQFPTDVPDKCYLVVKSGKEDKVMEGGTNLLTIWAVMNASQSSQPLYDQRWSMTVEGWAYTIGDFVVRVGSVVIRSHGNRGLEDRAGRQDSFKGAVLEVEYLASLDRNDSSYLVNEFVDVYSQPDGPTAVQVTGFKPVSNVAATKGLGSPHSLHWQTRTREYTNEHRAQSYVALFQLVMRSSSDSSSSSSMGSTAGPAAPGSGTAGAAGAAVPPGGAKDKAPGQIPIPSSRMH